jgi:hypothetical protein
MAFLPQTHVPPAQTACAHLELLPGLVTGSICLLLLLPQPLQLLLQLLHVSWLAALVRCVPLLPLAGQL